MYAVCLPVLLAPIINFREKSRLKKKHLYGIIRQWQDGNRKIVGFSACLELIDPRHHYTRDPDWLHLDGLCGDLIQEIDDATETDFPGSHQMPQRILDQLTKAEEVLGSSPKAPRAISVLHDNGSRLMIVVKAVLDEHVAAIRMYEVDAV